MTTHAQRKRRDAGCRRPSPRKPLLDRLVAVKVSSPIDGRRAMQASDDRQFQLPKPGLIPVPSRNVLWAALTGLFKPKPKKS